MKLHELKSEAKYFESIWSTRRGLELRNNDRDFIQGDVLMLREIDEDGEQTGRGALMLVMHVLQPDKIAFGLRAGFVALTVRLLARIDQKGTKVIGGAAQL